MKLNELLDRIDVDRADLFRRFENSAVLVERFLLKYLENDTFYILEEAEVRHDLERLAAAVHTLKGVAANLSMVTLEESCSAYLDDWQRGRRQCIWEDLEKIKVIHYMVVSGLRAYVAKFREQT